MRRIVSLLVVLVLCVTFACPVFAADSFVPSISEKNEPELVPPTGEQDAIGVIRDENGNILDYVHEHCLVITPLSKAHTAELIPDDARELLLSVYGDLSDGSMVLPYEKLGLDAENMVIRDLIDISFLCEDHPEMIAPEGVVLELTFDLGVAADTDVYVKTYKNDEWNPIVSVKNNGDGTVTCVFEHLCPVVFCVEASSMEPPAQTGDTSDITLWVVLLTVSAVGLVGTVVVRRKVAR